ncbi:MAG: hypothetical protein WBP34_08945, partial [Thermoanaerobaculia bacterium]
SREVLEVGSRSPRVTVHRQMIGPQRIDKDEDYVRPIAIMVDNLFAGWSRRTLESGWNCNNRQNGTEQNGVEKPTVSTPAIWA